jgi:hypothetical protein
MEQNRKKRILAIVTVNKSIRNMWQGYIDIMEDNNCKSLHLYQEFPSKNHDNECLFKPSNALEENTIMSSLRQVLNWRDAHILLFLSDFVAESCFYTTVILSQGRSLID